MHNKKLFLLDGMALIYRAHFALSAVKPIINSKGVNTSAAFGFTNTLIDLLKTQEPTHLAVVFDTSAPTERHILFPDYKAQREEMPEDLSLAIPVVKSLIQAFRIPVITLDGYEADDIIGTLARQAEREGYETYMVTPDKDFAQLVDEHTFIYKPGRQGSEVEILGIQEVKAKWNVERPEQVVDILGLWGDASDNIPGVPGIGEKTAQKLLAEYGSMENLLTKTHLLKGKQKENLELYHDQALLSKKLATINCEVPLTHTPQDLIRGPMDEAAVKALFIDLEFNALGRRLFGSEFTAGYGAKATAVVKAPSQTSAAETDIFSLSQEDATPTSKTESPLKNMGEEDVVADLKTISDLPHHYRHLTTESEIKSLLQKLHGISAYCFDTETSSLDPKEAQLLGLSFSWQAHEAVYVSLSRERDKALAQLELFRPLFNNPNILVVGHNLKFDLAILRSQGMRVRGNLFDTMIAHALIEPDKKHGMDYLSQVYLGYKPISITTLIGNDKEGLQKSMAEVDPAVLAEYAAEDADVTWQLYEKLVALLAEQGQEKVFYDVEMPLIPALVSMEQEGVSIDLFALEEFSQQLGAEIQKAEAEVYQLAGHEFNLKSPKQLGVVLFDELKLVEKPKKTKTGQYATDEQLLTTLAARHPIVARLLDHREASKLKSTYVDALPNAVSKVTGRIHTTFAQAATSTGRLASANPNLQNIPIRTDLGKEIRKAFVARDEKHLLLSADYSQIELRVLAAISQDPGMIEAFAQGLDIHSATAARVFGVTVDQVTDEMRRKAKMVNFGISYGISAFGLSQRLGIPRAEAAEIIDNYFTQFSGIRRYMDSTIEFCRKHGYVQTMTGRRRYLRDIHSANKNVQMGAERNAINMPIQGTSADMIKLAMGRIENGLEKARLRSRMLLQVHDELVFELPKEEEKTLQELVHHEMTHALPDLNKQVPIEVECGVGKNWLQAH
jgi:DNA polymerase I